jgi:phosphoserine phosphatase RsbU/P
MAVLQAFEAGAPGASLRVDGPKVVLGRHPECDIVLDAAAVSRQHAQILVDGSDYFIEDLHSRNGTFVNGQVVQGRQLLQDGDKLKICDLSFTFFRQQPAADLTEPALLQNNLNLATVLTEMVDDDQADGNSTIMSKLDAVPRRGSGAQTIVNPEMKLRAMIEIAHNLGKAVALDDVLPKLMDSLFKIFVQADRGFVILRSSPDGPLVTKTIKFRRADMEERARISRTIINQALEGKEAILSADAASDLRFESSQSIADLRIRSVMCAPLIDGDGNALGVIQIDAVDQRHRFTKDDLDVLVSIASQAAIAIDNATMHEAALKRQAIDRDLELAHKVQRGLLPAHPPQVPGYHFFDFYEPANQVGGDYYDYVELSDNRLAVVLADVSGKGVAAALLMAKLSGEVRYCLASEPTPAGAVDRINAAFCRSGWDDRFVTFVLAVVDRTTHEVTVVNAGHMPPMWRHSHSGGGPGEVDTIGAHEAGVPLGIDPDFHYLQTTRKLAVGDSVTMFTDGISEAMNADGDLYGLDRLRTQVIAEATNVSMLGRQILEDVRRFVGGRPQSDDMCLACFCRTQ